MCVCVQSRVVLRNSYAFGYYLTSGEDKAEFDMLQLELEVCTERLSQHLARPHFCVSARDIARATEQAATRCEELIAWVKSYAKE